MTLTSWFFRRPEYISPNHEVDRSSSAVALTKILRHPHIAIISEALSRIRRGGREEVEHNGHGTKAAILSSSSSSSGPLNDNRKHLSKHQTRKQSLKKHQNARKFAQDKQAEEVKRHREESSELAKLQEPEYIRASYGDLPLVQSNRRDFEARSQIEGLSLESLNHEITCRARVHAVRKMSANLVFVVFRQQLSTLQGVLQQREGATTTHMVRWVERVPIGSIVVVNGRIQKPKKSVKGCTIHDVELLMSQFHVVTRRFSNVPFTVYEDEMSKNKKFEDDTHTSHITDRSRLAHRLLDLRTTTSKAIFRINSGVCNLFRSYLDSQDFIEIHTPKLQAGATESGSSVFQLDYFGRPAFLAQSPQLAKQMCIAADFERVYEIGPIFRAENSNTHRHLTEYTGLDLEMAIEEHYHEAMELIDRLLKHIYKGIYERFGTELEAIRRHFPHEDLIWLKNTPKIPFAQGVQMLIDSGWKDEYGKTPSPDKDLHTRDEIRLGHLVKEKYNTDYYILDKFPVSARPFYTMPDPENSKVTNSFDIFLRGQEILTGGQRIHDAKMLDEQMRNQGIDPASMEEYMNGFRYAAPPHAGAGIGLERIIMLMLQLGNIRLASLFPRDPKSLPPQPPPPDLRHAEDSTLHPPWDESTPDNEQQMQPLENLIANYGDATNTSWIDERFEIWRDPATGAAMSYVPTNGYAILPGDPLCDISQYVKVTAAFLKWLKKETKLKPLWVLCGRDMEVVLGEQFGWRTFTCAAEERIDADKNDAEREHDMARKIRHAQKEGVKIIDIEEGQDVPDDVRKKCDARIQDWLAGRQGKQVHLSEITPWRDWSHRRYFYAQDKDGKICALVVLVQLARRHGYQVKYSLDFPDAPSGTIEHITLHAIHAAKASGTKSLTFGSAATSDLHAVRHLSGTRVQVLQRTYHEIAKQFKLAQKSDFRQKLGGEEDPVYVCYPPHGLGVSGARAIVQFFEADH